MLLYSQVCVVESAKRSPVATEYSVSGTTYAPEGIIFDSTGMQVLVFNFNFLSCFYIYIHAQAKHTPPFKAN